MPSKEIEDALLEKCRARAMWQLYNGDKAEYIKEIWSSADLEKLAQEYFSVPWEWFVGEDDPRFSHEQQAILPPIYHLRLI